MQMTFNNRSIMALVLTATLLVAVTAGAFMLTCAEDAFASEPSPSDTRGTACDLHEGHEDPDSIVVTLPDRSDVSDIAVSDDAAARQLASSSRVEATGSLVVPLPAADPLCGRLLL
jgi:hypothetical protein